MSPNLTRVVLTGTSITKRLKYCNLAQNSHKTNNWKNTNEGVVHKILFILPVVEENFLRLNLCKSAYGNLALSSDKCINTAIPDSNSKGTNENYWS